MRRRQFIALLGGAAAAWPWTSIWTWQSAYWQSSKRIPLVGILSA
jgi:hypothetical protein